MDTPGGIRLELLDAFGAGVYLLFGVIHLDLWLQRRERMSYLWLTGASAGALMVDVTGLALRMRQDQWLIVVNLLGVAVATAAVFELVVSLANHRAHRAERTAVALLLAGGPLAALSGVDALGAAFFVVCLAVLLLAMWRAYRAGRAGDPESTTIARGLFVLIATLMIDVSMELHLIPQIGGLPVFGFTVLFIASATSLNRRYDREHNELVTLREELEERVDQRTRELQEANRRLEEASRTDPLTSLPNRRAFIDAANHELKRALRSGRMFAVAMLDLDHFKRVNDSYGHAVGDLVLQQTTASLRAALRSQDIIARWGGEEFVILLPETNADGAAVAAESIRAAISSSFVELNGKAIHVTASLGIAEHSLSQTLDRTIAAADRALYRAKDEGRDRVVIAA